MREIVKENGGSPRAGHRRIRADEPASRPEPPVVPPPGTVDVWGERRPVLFTADGVPLVRRCGF